MKLKSAHIFLAAASLATLTVLAGCGSNSSGDLTSPGYVPGQLFNRGNSVLSVQISPRVASARVGQTTQLQANGGLDNGQTADVTNLVTWSSSDPSLASVDGNGRVLATGKVVGNALTGGTVTITATAGPVSDSIQFTVNNPTNKVFIANKTGNSISVFDINATGAVSAGHKIVGANTNLANPTQLAFSLNRQELFVANQGKGEIEVFYLQADGNVAPLRHIKSAFTTAVTGVAVNSNTNEVFALSAGQISVYDIAASGDAVVPKRTVITGATTTLATTTDAQISLVGNTNILVPNGLSLLTFGQNDTGNVAPVRTLLGPTAPVPPATTPAVFSKITTVANDGTNTFITDQGAAPNSVMQYLLTAAGNSNPTTTLTDGFAAPAGLLPVPGSGNLWVVDAAKVSLYGPALTPASLVRSFTSADLSGAAGIVITQSF
ncbi:Ig-like domain-containing protein [bacterium]|nr:Ig-like domain-containing protein [bacterium]